MLFDVSFYPGLVFRSVPEHVFHAVFTAQRGSTISGFEAVNALPRFAMFFPVSLQSGHGRIVISSFRFFISLFSTGAAG